MSVTVTTAAAIGTSEGTGSTLTNNSSTSSSEVDLLGDNASIGYLWIYVDFTSTVTVNTLDIYFTSSRVTGQNYADDAVPIASITPKSGSKLVDIAHEFNQGPIMCGRYGTFKAINNATGASITNLFVGYRVAKVA